MKKVMNALLILGTLSFAGCYKTKSESQLVFKLDPKEKETLTKQCREMNSYGDIMQLLAEINAETKEVLRLLEAEDMRQNEARITELADSIDKKSYAVISLSREEWIERKWNFEAKWVINKQDFKDVLGTHINQFEITGVDLQKIFFHGEEREDLRDNVKVVEGDNEIRISYKNKGSSLELCQLNKTMMILLDVNYRNVVNRNHRYFNLNLDF